MPKSIPTEENELAEKETHEVHGTRRVLTNFHEANCRAYGAPPITNRMKETRREVLRLK